MALSCLLAGAIVALAYVLLVAVRDLMKYMVVTVGYLNHSLNPKP